MCVCLHIYNDDNNSAQKKIPYRNLILATGKANSKKVKTEMSKLRRRHFLNVGL